MNTEIDKDAGEDQEAIEKTMAERAKEVGRDGAYLEVEAKDLIKSYKSGELQKAKIIVITAARTDVSEPNARDTLVSFVKQFIERVAEDKIIDNLSDEQLSLIALQDALFVGLDAYWKPIAEPPKT